MSLTTFSICPELSKHYVNILTLTECNITIELLCKRFFCCRQNPIAQRDPSTNLQMGTRVEDGGDIFIAATWGEWTHKNCKPFVELLSRKYVLWMKFQQCRKRKLSVTFPHQQNDFQTENIFFFKLLDTKGVKWWSCLVPQSTWSTLCQHSQGWMAK